MFTKGFDRYTCDGNTITCTVDGFDCTATIHRDTDAGAPYDRQDGFWPSLDPKNAGYIGDGRTPEDYETELARVRAVLDAWKQNEWWYVGVAVKVSKNGIQLTGKFDHALWGVECNYPGSDNSYLMEVANEELGEAVQAAKDAVTKLAPLKFNADDLALIRKGLETIHAFGVYGDGREEYQAKIDTVLNKLN